MCSYFYSKMTRVLFFRSFCCHGSLRWVSAPPWEFTQLILLLIKIAFPPCCFAAGGLRERRHRGVPGGQTRQALLHRSQLPTPGWTHGHRRNHRVSSGCLNMQKASGRRAAGLVGLVVIFRVRLCGIICPQTRCAASRLEDSHHEKVAEVEKSEGWMYGGGAALQYFYFKACVTRNKRREQVESVRRRAQRWGQKERGWERRERG